MILASSGDQTKSNTNRIVWGGEEPSLSESEVVAGMENREREMQVVVFPCTRSWISGCSSQMRIKEKEPLACCFQWEIAKNSSVHSSVWMELQNLILQYVFFDSGYQLKAETSNSAWVEAEGSSASLDHSEVNAILTDHRPPWPECMLPRDVATAESCSEAFPYAFLESSSSLLMLKRSKLNNWVTP